MLLTDVNAMCPKHALGNFLVKSYRYKRKVEVKPGRAERTSAGLADYHPGHSRSTKGSAKSLQRASRHVYSDEANHEAPMEF